MARNTAAGAPAVDWEIHEDIARAWTLPAHVYGDPALHDALVNRVFRSSWQWVGDTDRLKAPGRIEPLTLLPGCLDEPLLLTRDDDDRLHCLSNVCTHRGHPVATDGGHAGQLRCRYHGRRFGLDGQCRFMPEFDKVEGFPSQRDHLPRVPLETWGKLLFASTAPRTLLSDHTAELDRRLGFLDWDGLTFDAERSRDYHLDANWALYVDNYLEGFHIPFVHASLSDALDPVAYRTELFDHGNVQIGIARDGEDAFDHAPETSDGGEDTDGERVAAYYFWLFPNTMINVYPWGVSLNVVQPRGPRETTVRFLTWVGDRSRLDRGAGSGLDRVEREDEVVVEATQKGVRSRLYHRGRYSPTREQGVHHFHRLLTRALEDTP